jgi:hypothetical protein
MSVMDMQFEIDQERAKRAASADLAWELEEIMYNALMCILKQKGDKTPVEIADEVLRERQNIMRRSRATKVF